MTEDLARSDRPTARATWPRTRARIAPGPLRQASLRQPGRGIARGMITGALLAIGVLAAFTLPFLREGPEPVAPARHAGAKPAPEITPAAGMQAVDAPHP